MAPYRFVVATAVIDASAKPVSGFGYDLEGKQRMFFNFRLTGASHIAQRGNPASARQPRMPGPSHAAGS
ncbi:MAG: hypothetical protein JWO56_2296 [Acidobacteria bacterium]|nr:hypothetical protein [Acidobacteriota bacterium]